MVTLVKELPYAAVVGDHVIATVCSNCFKSSERAPFSHCAACKIVRYCSATCQKADWKDHKMECQFLQRAPPCVAYDQPMLQYEARYPPTVRLASRILMKMSRGDFGKSFNGRTINDLMDHIGNLKSIPAYLARVTRVCEELRKFMDGQVLPDDDGLLSVLGKISCNSFQIGSKRHAEIGTGLYLGLSVHNHSCDADAFMDFDGATMELHAKAGVKYSKQILVSYTDFYQTNAERKIELLVKYFFECSCPWCRDPDHEGWALSVRSPCCPDSACLLREDSTELACNKCGKINNKITVAGARNMSKELRTKIDSFKTCVMRKGMPGFAAYLHLQIETCERFAKVFSPWNMNLANFGFELSRMAFENGEADIAKKYATAKIAANRKYLGPGHRHLSVTYIKAADMMGLDNKEALDLVKEGHALALSCYGPDSNVTKMAAEQLEKIAQFSKSKGKGKQRR